jgi:nucleoside-diphosphate-sugar epimerase
MILPEVEMQGKTLIIGAGGQIGIELVLALRNKLGNENVVASDLRPPQTDLDQGPFVTLDTLDRKAMEDVVRSHGITEVYQLAAMLSATAERFPEKAWQLNMDGLFNVLELAREGCIKRIFWPSSIAVFGPTSPKTMTPQATIMEPTSVYGISKLAGERWCEYYHKKYQVDVRSLRYPGLIGYKSEPGGGTTDYAVDIFYSAIEKGHYTCFLGADTMLPMMMMEDAIRATLTLMEAPSTKLSIRSSYNLAGMSFTPAMLSEAIRAIEPEFSIDYHPDFRQGLADSWPDSIDDSTARSDWGWRPDFDLRRLTERMMLEIRRKKVTLNAT